MQELDPVNPMRIRDTISHFFRLLQLELQTVGATYKVYDRSRYLSPIRLDRNTTPAVGFVVPLLDAFL
jgi:hypothetical protein